MMDAFIVKEDEISNRVLPSGSACATSSAPMMPPAPARFSTIMLRLRRLDNCCATVRPTMSLLAPGANGIMRWIGLEVSCACAVVIEKAKASDIETATVLAKVLRPVEILYVMGPVSCCNEFYPAVGGRNDHSC